MTNLSRLLHSDENIIWQGKPVFKAFVFGGHSIVLFVFGLIFMATPTFMLLMTLQSGAPLFIFSLIPLIFVIVGFGIAFGSPISSALAHRNTEYAITNKRLIIQTGAIGLKTRFIDFEKIQEVSIKVGLMDKIFRTGGIYADTASSVRGWNYYSGSGRGYNVMHPDFIALKDPYKVHNILQEAMKDMKSSD